MAEQRELWARASLKIISDHISVKDLENLFGRSTVARDGAQMLLDLEEDSAGTIDELMASVSAFLAVNMAKFELINMRSTIELRIGWMPISGMAGMTISRELIESLAQARVEMLIDIYGD